MTEQGKSGLAAPVRSRLERLGSGWLLAILVGLFVADLFVPDPLPYVDEALLFLGSVLLARWRRKRRRETEPEATR